MMTKVQETALRRLVSTIDDLRATNAALLEALQYIVNDTPESGEDAELTVKGYNMACEAIRKATE